MRYSSEPGNNGASGDGPASPRNRPRGAIRTHLGRKRTGARHRAEGAPGSASSERRRDEDQFERLRARFEALFEAAGEKTASSFDAALDAACDTLVAAGEFTAESGERLREFLRRDVLHREHPGLTFRTGDITSPGTFSCDRCGWTIVSARSSMLPACPQCGDTHFRKTP